MSIRRTAATIFASVVVSLTADAASGSHGTADWAQANLARLEGKSVTLQVAMCEPGRVDGPHQWFRLYTFDVSQNGGSIEAVMPTSATKSFFSRVGAKIERRSDYKARTVAVSGILRRDRGGHAYLDIDANVTTVPPFGHGQRTMIRTWTSADGRTIEAEFISATATHVKFRRTSDGQVFTFELAKLSPADRDFVAAQRQ